MQAFHYFSIKSKDYSILPFFDRKPSPHISLAFISHQFKHMVCHLLLARCSEVFYADFVTLYVHRTNKNNSYPMIVKRVFFEALSMIPHIFFRIWRWNYRVTKLYWRVFDSHILCNLSYVKEDSRFFGGVSSPLSFLTTSMPPIYILNGGGNLGCSKTIPMNRKREFGQQFI